MNLPFVYKLLLLVCIWFLSITGLQAQSQAALDTAVFILVEKLPEYPGGYKEFVKFVQERLGIDPQDKHLHKKVYVEFIVNKSGQLQQVRILRGVNEQIDKEVFQVVEQSPKWIPGRQKDVPVFVKTSVVIPVEE